MSLDVWFKDDIRNTLLALSEASQDTHAQVVSLVGESPTAQSYRSGYGDALRAVAIAFGITAPRMNDERAASMPRLEAGHGAARRSAGRILDRAGGGG